MDLLYLDHNSTTPLLPEAWEAMRPFFLERYGNPASSHRAGRLARQALEDARERIAHLLGAHADEVLFTSGATEANNLALLGQCGVPPGTILSSQIEHPCVTEPVKQLERLGFRIACLPVSPSGCVDLDGWTPPADLRLASLMLVNHETGAVQPVAELVDQLAGMAPVHCDAAAAAGKIAVDFHRLGVATLTVSAHKFHGPKGIGALLVNRCARIRPLLWGGHQQHGRRPGTEAVPLAVGMAVALEWCVRQMEPNLAHVTRLREGFLQHLRDNAAPVVLNGPETGGIPHTLNLSFPGVKADVLLMNLDLAGVACSTGSACSSGSLLPSPVLQAMRVETDVLRSAMRFSLGPGMNEAEVTEAASRICRCINRLRHDRAE